MKKFKGFIKDLFNKMEKDEAQPYAHQLTYSLLLSLFPFIIFLLTMVSFMDFDTAKIMNNISRMMPSDAYKMFSGVVEEVMKNQSGGLMSISIIAAIWAASAGFKAFMKAMNKIHGIREDRGFIKLNLFSLLYVVLLALGLTGTFFMLIFSNKVMAMFQSFTGVELSFLKSVLSKLLPILFLFVLFLCFYMFVPAKNVKFKHAFPGAIFATLSFILVSLGFKFYVEKFANYSKFYGAMGTVVMLMFWLLLISQIMIIGGEINALLITKNNVSNPFIRSSLLKDAEISKKAIEKAKKINKDSVFNRR